jgi:hypothetical protein
MAEVLASVGLASNVLHFLDFGASFVSKAWSIYHEGEEAVESARGLKVITVDLQRVAKSLETTKADDSSEVARISRECSQVATELLTSLHKIGTPNIGNRKSAVKTAFKLMWTRDEIECLRGKLDGFRQQLIVQLLVSVR